MAEPSRGGSDRNDLDRYLLVPARKSKITNLGMAEGAELRKSFVLALALAPAWVIEEFVKLNNCAGNDAVAEHVQHGLRRRIEVRVHMQEGNRLRIVLLERRYGVLEPTFIQAHVRRDGRQGSYSKRAFFMTGPPILRQSLEGIEAVDLTRSERGNEIDGGAGVDAKLADEAGDLCLRDGRFQQLELVRIAFG